MAFDIEIRPARLEDAAAIRAMIAALAAETIGPQQSVLSVEDVRRYGFGRQKSIEPFVADRAGEIVAAMLLYDEFSSWRGKKGVYVLDIYIAPAARGAGLGRAMIAQAAAWGRSRGAAYVRLSVDPDNIAAMDFYRTIGFHESAHDRVFILEGDAFGEIE